MIGLYCIENLINKKCYVGQSIDVKRRIRRHKFDLRRGKHINHYLQNAWNKYGEECFVFRIIEECSLESLLEKEIEYIARYDSFENGYNLTMGGESGFTSFLGKKHSSESRRKMSASKLGKKLPESTKLNMRKSAKGFTGKHTEEARKKMSLAKEGRKLKPETIEKIRELRLGHKLSEETKKKISDSHKGKKMSEETKKKISDTKKIQFSKEQEDEIRQRIKKGESFRSISKDFGCSHMTIRRRFAL